MNKKSTWYIIGVLTSICAWFFLFHNFQNKELNSQTTDKKIHKTSVMEVEELRYRAKERHSEEMTDNWQILWDGEETLTITELEETSKKTMVFIEELPDETLKKITQKIESSGAGTEQYVERVEVIRPINSWYMARRHLMHNFLLNTLIPDNIPNHIFESEEYSIFADFKTPDFSTGYAIRKADGKLYSWNFKPTR